MSSSGRHEGNLSSKPSSTYPGTPQREPDRLLEVPPIRPRQETGPCQQLEEEATGNGLPDRQEGKIVEIPATRAQQNGNGNSVPFTASLEQ